MGGMKSVRLLPSAESRNSMLSWMIPYGVLYVPPPGAGPEEGVASLPSPWYPFRAFWMECPYSCRMAAGYFTWALPRAMTSWTDS
jgi:hypothetical protein